MNFSIILASRERVHLLDSLLNSIVNTTSDKTNCEVIVVLDNDDRVTKRFLERLKAICPFAKFVFRDRAPNLNDDYLNWAWKNYSTGKYVLVVNDDVIFKTPNWDQMAVAHLSRFLADKPDGIAYGWIEDGLKNRQGNINYCCFPLVTRKAAEILGFVMPPEFPGWGADIGLFRIYSSLNRICEITDVVLEHISHHNGMRERDHISHAVEKRSAGTPNPFSQFDPFVYIDKFLNHLSNSSSPSGAKAVTISGATLTGATLTDVTIVGGKIVGGRIEGGKLLGGRVEGGILKSGIVDGDLKCGDISNLGNVVLS
jgi:hypothetical protein